MKYGFGVDIGGTTIKIGLFSVEGDLIEKWEIPTNKTDNGKHILKEIADFIHRTIEEKNIDKTDVLGVGLGVPGPVNKNGVVNGCVNLGWNAFNVEKEFNEISGFSVKVGNDANVAALGEMWQGAGKGYQDVLMVTLGTGVGGGCVLDGKIVSGIHGAGGEIGHMPVKNDEPIACNCGNHGCLEQYVSATGIVTQAKKMLENDYAPGFYVKHFVKDLKIAVDEAHFPLYGVNRVIKEYVDLMDRGMSDLGTQCLIEYFRKPQIKAVIFDMDGLMFNTEKMFKDEFKEKAKELGVSCPDYFPEPLIGCDSRKVALYEEMYPGVTQVMEEIQDERVDYFFKYFKEPGSANMVGLQNLIAYIEENKIPYAVASSSHPQAIKKFLSHAGFVLSPNVIVSSKEGYKSKPAPDVFLAAAERLGVEPENCLVLDDSKHGIMAAANAKMHSIFIQDQIAPDDEMKEYIQESCTDLNGVIDYLKRCK